MDEKQSIKKIICICSLVLLCGGCSAKPIETVYITKTEIVEVYVPVLQDIKQIEPIKKPKYEIPKLTKDSTIKQVVEAYVNDNETKDRYINVLEKALAPFIKDVSK